MKTTGKSTLIVCALVICAAGAYALWRSAAKGSPADAGRKVLYYQDSMHPWVKSDKPGKCTVCAMDLTPILEGDQGFASQEGLVILSSNSITVLDVQTEEVRRQPLTRSLRVAGTLEANETKRTVVSAPAIGRVDSLFVDYVGVEVKMGDPLVTFYSPGFANQTRRFAFLGGLARPAERPQADVAAHAGARMSEMETMRSGPTQITQNPDPRKTLDTTTYFTDLLAPQAGTVVERNVNKGQYVQEGEKLFTLVDSSVLWFRFDVYEQHLAWLRLGQKLNVTIPAIPGKPFPATISFIEPTLNEATRTVRVRADVQNPLVEDQGPGMRRRLLHFGLFAEGQLQAQVPDVAAVSRSAILLPGDRAYAYVEKASGAYERREVRVGRQGDTLWEVLDGLDEGDRVVTSGNVLLDAQAQFTQGAEVEHSCCEKKESEELASAEHAPGQSHDPAASPHPMTGAHASPQHAASSAAASRPTPEAHSVAPVDGPRGGRLTASERLRAAIGSRLSGTAATPTHGLAPSDPAAPAGLTAAGRKAIEEFLSLADGVSRALAADNLKQFTEQAAKLRPAVSALEKEFPAPHRWNGLVRRFTVVSQMPAAKDLAEARKQFLPLSVSTVELVRQLRKEDQAFAGAKVYFCPMAPKPGLWFQAKGPLRNPYYGGEMLTCGEEVKGDGTVTLGKANSHAK